jgi:hypothetical protein
VKGSAPESLWRSLHCLVITSGILINVPCGCALAVPIAARRTDIVSIGTVPRNLDDEFANRLHPISPMPRSENPVDFASRVAAISQVQFSGTGDRVVPPVVAQRFVRATGDRCSQARSVPGMTHEGDGATCGQIC